MKLIDNKEQFNKVRGVAVELDIFNNSNITADYLSWLNDPIVFQYSNQRFISHDSDSCIEYLKSFDETCNLFLTISVKKTKKHIGTLTVYFNEDHGVADIGIMIGNRDVWGKGYGQDAWNTILSWLLNNKNVRKVSAGTLACNFPMKSIIENSGMSIEGVRKEHEVHNGEPQDVILFAILSKEN
jgi:ribosomal-protein-alanine N-acetyltransferase